MELNTVGIIRGQYC